MQIGVKFYINIRIYSSPINGPDIIDILAVIFERPRVDVCSSAIEYCNLWKIVGKILTIHQQKPCVYIWSPAYWRF